MVLATVRVDNLCVTKGMRFDKTVTVKEALIRIAEKCSLDVPEQELCESYILYVPPNNSRSGKYLTQEDSLLLSSVFFVDRDEIHVKKAYPLVIINGDGTETTQDKVDLEQTGQDLFVTLCKKYFYTSSQWELYKKNTTDEKETQLDLSRTLKEQGVTGDTCIVFRAKKQNILKNRLKKKPSTSTVSGPMFVKHSKDDNVLFTNSDSPARGCGRPIFGFPLTRALEQPGDLPNREIPSLVSASIEFIRANALQVTGLFRISAKSELVDTLKEKFDNNALEVSFDNDEDPHLVCSIFKQYLRDLPEPVIPYRFYHDFLNLYDIHEEDVDSMKEDLTVLVHSLPPENFCLLKTLCTFLQEITKHEEINKMNARNLSTVFGPNLLRFPDNNDMLMIMRDTPRLSSVTSAMITLSPNIFTNRPKVKPVQKLATVGYVRCFCSYQADVESSCEISISRGDVIIVFAQQKSGWWVGSIIGSNIAGFFPSNFCSTMTSSLSEAKEIIVPEEIIQNDTESDAKQNGTTSANTEEDIESLKQQLKEQKEKLNEEQMKRQEMENFFHEQLDKFSSLFDLHTKISAK
uniref:Uncharacterized protein n=1 Tax=Vannella robusta TaxID=1487602 RepID=A0A7S4HJD5_9EUKA